MLRIAIETIPHEQQRYETVGDWWADANGVWRIEVSDMSDPRYELLVAVHELVEMALCRQKGITEEEVTKFDMAFEAARRTGDHSEPGDSELAPYRDEHTFATFIERAVALKLGVDWDTYNKQVEEL